MTCAKYSIAIGQRGPSTFDLRAIL